MNNKYDSESIKILEGLEAVRKTPSMYIGSVSEKGFHHLLWEIVDNSIDEVLAGFCNSIIVSLLEDNTVTVEDDGRGIPVDIHPKTNKSSLETVLTTLHAGGKFDKNSYKISGGLHGVGSSVVNALSEFLVADVARNNKQYRISFSNGGTLEKPLQVIGPSPKKGTKITFKPDPAIFGEEISFNFSTIQNRIQQLAYLNKNTKLILRRKVGEKLTEETFLYSEGIKDYVKDLKPSQSTLLNDIFYFSKEENKIKVEFSFAYNNSFEKDLLFTFCNNINTPEGGTHEEGLIRILRWSFNRYNKLKFNNNFQFTWEDIKEGFIGVLSIQHTNPQFEGQTKTKLGNSDAGKAVYASVKDSLWNFLMENPEGAKQIIGKIIISCKGRQAAERAKNEVTRKNLIDNQFKLFGKLSDCRSKKAEETELFIVEGDSAGGSAKLGRDNYYQAILPLRGKILNVEKNKMVKMIGNREIQSIFTAVGFNHALNLDLNNVRYSKIIIMTDADVDGSHIRILLLTLFYRYLKELIINGFIYVAQPPLYKISFNRKNLYLYSDEELKAKKQELQGTKFTVQRYKGLGEMNPEQLWTTTMDPESRHMRKITIDDATEANQVITNLMGDDVLKRKKFIEDSSAQKSLLG